MNAWVHCTDFILACKAAGFRRPSSGLSSLFGLSGLAVLNLLQEIDETDQIDQTDQINRSLSGLGLTGRLGLFAFEFSPAVIEPLGGCAGCVQRFGSFL